MATTLFNKSTIKANECERNLLMLRQLIQTVFIQTDDRIKKHIYTLFMEYKTFSSSHNIDKFVFFYNSN